MKAMKFLGLALAVLLAHAAPANATLIVSDVQVTTNSVTFTIDGDMTGYAFAPAESGYLEQFSIVYLGDLWTGTAGFVANSWSTSVFDNEAMWLSGNTGAFGPNNYTWSSYTNNLSDAYAVQRQVTVNLGSDFLNPLATSGEIRFVWGNGSQDPLHTVLASVSEWNRTAVPEPATLSLFALGLAMAATMRRRRIAR